MMAAQTLVEMADERVDFDDSFSCQFALRTIFVTVCIGLFQIGHDEVRALVLRFCQLFDDAIDALFSTQTRLVVIIKIGVRVLTENGHVGARPIEHSRAQTLTLSREPDGLATIVLRVSLLLRVAERKHFSALGIEERVGNNAVMVGIETRSQCVVVGECLRGE